MDLPAPAYRIYLQGYWLEGGEPTFWFQPGYRWIAGALHMLFGDSSLGEFHWDGICLAIMALFAHELVARVAGFKWGLMAAATVLTLVMQGPPWIYWGVGLSEHAAAGFIYAAALIAVMAASWRLRLAAGVLAILGFFVRLNNLPIAFAIAVFAIPLDVRVRDLWTPRQWLPRVDWRTAGFVIGAAVIGVLLFSLRTWHYTGVFSFFQGTTLGTNAIWQPGMPIGELRTPDGRQRVDGAVDERSTALRLVRYAAGGRGGDFGGRSHRRAGGPQLAALAGVVLRRGIVRGARRARRGVHRPLLDHPDRHAPARSRLARWRS